MKYKINLQNDLMCLAALVELSANSESASGPYILLSRKFEALGEREDAMKASYALRLDNLDHNSDEAEEIRNQYIEEMRELTLERCKIVLSMLQTTDTLSFFWEGKDITAEVYRCLSVASKVEAYALDNVNRYYKQLSSVEYWLKNGFMAQNVAMQFFGSDPCLMLVMRTIEKTILEAGIVPKTEEGMLNFVAKKKDTADAVASIAKDLLKGSGMEPPQYNAAPVKFD